MKLVKSLLVVGVAAAVLSGCGGNNDQAANSAASPAASAAASPAASAPAADATTTASIVNQADAFKTAVSENGNWIIAILNDLTVDGEVVVAGEFHDKGDAAKDIYRKIALYAQDADHNITATYTLTVPKFTVKSENLKVQGGTIKGDVYVQANGFTLDKTATVDGNIFYASADFQASAKVDGKVTGEAKVQ
ncbi:polymer-forming cytoskeletal protein [Paenibacillus rhizophilus]|uniref:Polymer-forming cytoskeletal protein n=1 Tax=Paenibacillus rhizophilus TaxID=1850366 RepID=A0A3N9PA07_9BACL|nr:polymer-forming cytoskeletal protein [Paenibacillus rhizophilus]RQW13078.1 polymer-forming cytoskeletal protein [Paenibacillus rhizophilus]